MNLLKPALSLMLLATGIAFGANLISSYVAPIEYKGHLGYTFSEGINPISAVIFELDDVIAENLIVLDVPEGWSYTLEGNLLRLSGGVLHPGETLDVKVSLKKYVEPDEYTVSSSGFTEDGDVISSSGPLVIREMITLKLIEMSYAWRLPLAFITVGTGVLEIYRTRKKVESVIDLRGPRYEIQRPRVQPTSVAHSPLKDEKIQLKEDPLSSFKYGHTNAGFGLWPADDSEMVRPRWEEPKAPAPSKAAPSKGIVDRFISWIKSFF